MPTPTVNYAFNLPTVGADDDVWGDLLNDNWTDLDAQLFSGTIGADTTGNAATATLATLATSATALDTARTFTIGATGKAFDGSADVSWDLAEIGLLFADQAEAEAGTDNTKLMTPLRVAQSVAENAPAPAQLTQGQAEDPASTVFGTASGERLAQAFDAREQQIGVGQTWQAVTRASGTNFQNTTGRPIMVSVNGVGNNTSAFVGAGSNPSLRIAFNNAPGTGQFEQNHISFIVPDQHYYRLSGGYGEVRELR
jgi:hypothetical protein